MFLVEDGEQFPKMNAQIPKHLIINQKSSNEAINQGVSKFFHLFFYLLKIATKKGMKTVDKNPT